MSELIPPEGRHLGATSKGDDGDLFITWPEPMSRIDRFVMNIHLAAVFGAGAKIEWISDCKARVKQLGDWEIGND